jgi:hypothetical protein
MNSIKKYIQIISHQIRVFVLQLRIGASDLSQTILTSLHGTFSEREESSNKGMFPSNTCFSAGT